jgi:hypothetical protein
MIDAVIAPPLTRGPERASSAIASVIPLLRMRTIFGKTRGVRNAWW